MNNDLVKNQVKILLIYMGMQVIPALAGALAGSSQLIDATIYTSLIAYFIGTLTMIYINQTEDFHTSLSKGYSLPPLAIIFWGIVGFVFLFFSQQITSWIEHYVFHQTMGSANTHLLLDIIRQYPFYLILVTLLAPIAEEFVFRKVIFGWLYDRTGGLVAALISSLFFAFMHMDGHLLLYGVMGGILCFLYYRTKNIATPIIAHVLLNSLAVLPLFIN